MGLRQQFMTTQCQKVWVDPVGCWCSGLLLRSTNWTIRRRQRLGHDLSWPTGTTRRSELIHWGLDPVGCWCVMVSNGGADQWQKQPRLLGPRQSLPALGSSSTLVVHPHSARGGTPVVSINPSIVSVTEQSNGETGRQSLPALGRCRRSNFGCKQWAVRRSSTSLVPWVLSTSRKGLRSVGEQGIGKFRYCQFAPVQLFPLSPPLHCFAFDSWAKLEIFSTTNLFQVLPNRTPNAFIQHNCRREMLSLYIVKSLKRVMILNYTQEGTFATAV